MSLHHSGRKKSLHNSDKLKRAIRTASSLDLIPSSSMEEVQNSTFQSPPILPNRSSSISGFSASSLSNLWDTVADLNLSDSKAESFVEGHDISRIHTATPPPRKKSSLLDLFGGNVAQLPDMIALAGKRKMLAERIQKRKEGLDDNPTSDETIRRRVLNEKAVSDLEDVVEFRHWLEQLLGRSLSTHNSPLADILQDGTVLCEAWNRMHPEDTIRYSNSFLSKFIALDNIAKFLQKCKEYKIINKEAAFEPLDIFEKKVSLLVACIMRLIHPERKRTVSSPEDYKVKEDWKKWEARGKLFKSKPSSSKEKLEVAQATTIPSLYNRTVNELQRRKSNEATAIISIHDEVTKTEQNASVAIIREEEENISTKKSSREVIIEEKKGKDDGTSSPVNSNRRDSLKKMPSVIRWSTGAWGSSHSYDYNDDEDDWETEADVELPPVTLTLNELPAEMEDYEYTDDSSSGTESFLPALGVYRGSCEALNTIRNSCECTKYYQDGNGGGPCMNCGHYPTEHEDRGRVTNPEVLDDDVFLAARFGNSYKNWLINFEDIELHFKIGDGAFGAVYRAQLWGKTVAVKVMKADSVTSLQMDEFRKEVEIMSSLRHPNIVLFMGAVMRKENLCIVTEIKERGSLADVLANHNYHDTLDWSLRLSIMIDASLGMQYLHQMGIVHRDLKPSNLLVGTNWQVSIADFGLSFSPLVVGDDSLSFGGDMCIGTPGYIAPEVINGAPPSFAADVFAMGVILWEVLTGERAWEGHTDALSIAASVSRLEMPSIPRYAPSSYADLINSCWSLHAEDRPTFTEVAFSLRRQLQKGGASKDADTQHTFKGKGSGFNTM